MGKGREYQQRNSTMIPGNSYLYLGSCAFKHFIESNQFPGHDIFHYRVAITGVNTPDVVVVPGSYYR